MSRSVQLEAVYLEALLYCENDFLFIDVSVSLDVVDVVVVVAVTVVVGVVVRVVLADVVWFWWM